MSEEKEKRGPCPWINEYAQAQVKWRDGDIVISVPPKSGTTWTMTIVHQLREGGVDDFDDIYAEVRWLEFMLPNQTEEELAKSFDTMPTNKRRAFKTHAAPPKLPYLPPPPSPDNPDSLSLKYVVVFRNPEEAVASLYPFMKSHNPEFGALYNSKQPEDTFEQYIENALTKGLVKNVFFGFLAAWWPLRNNKNVFLIHYRDLVKNQAESIEKIAKFLDLQVTAEQMSRVLEFTSFNYMKAHSVKYEGATIAPLPLLLEGSMIRKGAVGKANEDGIDDDCRKRILAIGQSVFPDNEEALNWGYNGGNFS